MAPDVSSMEGTVMKRMFVSVCALCVLLALATQPLHAAVTIEQYRIHDFAFKAQVAGNPFDIEVRGEFSGPGGLRIVVPGFYDGDNTWKIRFAPTVPGAWSMRTVSSVAALNGQTESAITATANTNASLHGGLLVDPLNRHHFKYEDGTRYFLMGYEADWLAEADMKDPQRKVMHRLIDQIAARGFNHVLVNVYAHDTSWAKGTQNQWDYGPPAMYVFGGTNEQPDHSKLNTDYFKIYDVMMQALQDKGIVANVMIKVYNKMVNWPAPGSKDEERYFRYVTARYQAFSNVTWDFAKEAYNEHDKPLQSRLIDLIRATDGYHRLTTAHDNDIVDWDQAANGNLDFRTDQEHSYWMETLLFDRNLRQWPIINSELYYERGVDNLATYGTVHDWQLQVRGAYEVYLSGGYFVYYYANTAWDGFKPDPEAPGMARFKILRDNLSTLPYWKMEPKPDLAIGGPCLATPGQVYACYVTPTPARPGAPANAGRGTAPAPGAPPAARGGAAAPAGGGAAATTAAPNAQGGGRRGIGNRREIALNLSALSGSATLQWVNTWTGERVDEKVDGPGVYQLFRPASFDDAPALLIVKSVQ
jgi:hypothetical protein